MVVLDGLQITSDFDALSEGIFCCFKNLVADAVLQAGQEKLVLDEFEGVRNAFGFDLGLGSSGSYSVTNSSHHSRFFIRQTLVGHLDAICVVIDGFL